MDNNFYDSIFVSIASQIFKNNFSNVESRTVVLINSFVNNAMSCSCPEWTSCDLMTAFQKPPIIVRPYVPTNGADPAGKFALRQGALHTCLTSLVRSSEKVV